MGSSVRRSAAVLVLALGLAAPAGADAPGSDRIDAAEAAVASRPGDLELRVTLITLLVEQRRSDEALREIDELDALAPRETRVPYLRARALLELGRAAEAEDALLHASSPRALTLRGQLREERGERAGAIADFTEASRRAPTIELDLALGRVLERDGRVDEASAVLERGVARTGAAVLRVQALELARRSGAHDRALAHADALVRSVPGSARWRVLRASVLRDLGRSADASRELREAVTLADRMVRRRGSALSLQERARVRIALEQPDAAEADLVRALRLAPQLVEARRMLAAVRASR